MKDIFEGLSVALTEADIALVTERLEVHNKEIKDGVKNDAEFLSSVKASEAGRIYGSLERELSRKFPDLDTSQYEGKTGMERVKLVLNDGLSNLEQSKDTTSQEWQAKFTEAKAEFARFKEEEVPTILENERNGFYSRFIGDEILKDSLDFETTIANDFRVATVETYLHKNGYKSKWNPKEETYEIVTADGVKPTKNDKVLSRKEIIEDAFEVAGVLVKNNGKPKEGQNPGDTGGKSNGKLSANAQRMLDTTNVG